MKDNIIISGHEVIMRKPLWDEQEILIAKCLWFDVSIEGNTITANLKVTFRKALIAFLDHVYPVFMQQPMYAADRAEVIATIDAVYMKIQKVRTDKMKAKLPWYDKLWKHQRQVISAGMNRKVNMFSLEPRLGKSVSTCSLSIVADISRTVVICYDIGKWNWMYDMTDPKWGGTHILNKENFTILDRTSKRSLTAFDERFVIVNYDSLDNFINKIVASGPPVGHIIISECQRVKNHQSAKWKAVSKLVSLCPDARITFESGTPIMNRVDDLFAYFRLVGHPLGEKYSEFKKLFAETAFTGRGAQRREKVVGIKNMQLLQLCSSNFIIRKTQAECLDMPKHSYTNLYFDIGEWKPQYNAAVQKMLLEENKRVRDGHIHSINRIMGMAKVQGLIEQAEILIESEQKVVFLCLYTDSLNALAAHFGDRCVTIDGRVEGGKEKTERAMKFKTDPNCMVACVNMIAAGHTVSLSSASHAFVVNLPLSPKVLQQATDRLKDMSKTEPTNIYYALCKGEDGEATLDDRLLALNVSKDTDINALLDNDYEGGMQEGVVHRTTEDLIGELKELANG